MNDVLSTNRRQFLLGSAAVSTLALTSTSCLAESGEQNPSNRTFPYGIASGDPTQTSLVIWTQAEGQARVEWQLATDEQFKTVAKSGVASTGPSKDFTVKVDVNGLKPGVQYYYRFSSNGKLSPVGRAKTLPVGRVDSLNIAVASCSHCVWAKAPVVADRATAVTARILTMRFMVSSSGGRLTDSAAVLSITARFGSGLTVIV